VLLLGLGLGFVPVVVLVRVLLLVLLLVLGGNTSTHKLFVREGSRTHTGTCKRTYIHIYTHIHCEHSQLFGDITREKTGINFEKYNDIPVESSSEYGEVPAPIDTFDDLGGTISLHVIK
jgi:hypothetical protein